MNISETTGIVPAFVGWVALGEVRKALEAKSGSNSILAAFGEPKSLLEWEVLAVGVAPSALAYYPMSFRGTPIAAGFSGPCDATLVPWSEVPPPLHRFGVGHVVAFNGGVEIPLTLEQFVEVHRLTQLR